MEGLGLQFRVLYRDRDLVKVRATAWNRAFGGATDVYVGTGQLGEVAEQLRGFPTGTADNREVMLGAFGAESAGGGMSMQFRCGDRAGHAYVETKIDSDWDSEHQVQSAALWLLIEASAVDSFVEDLRRLDQGTGATARLTATASI